MNSKFVFLVRGLYFLPVDLISNTASPARDRTSCPRPTAHCVGAFQPRDNLKSDIVALSDALFLVSADFKGLFGSPVERESQRAARLNDACEVSQVHARGRPAEVEDDPTIGRIGRLLQKQQGVYQPGLTRTVCAKEAGNWPEGDIFRVFQDLKFSRRSRVHSHSSSRLRTNPYAASCMYQQIWWPVQCIALSRIITNPTVRIIGPTSTLEGGVYLVPLKFRLAIYLPTSLAVSNRFRSAGKRRGISVQMMSQ